MLNCYFHLCAVQPVPPAGEDNHSRRIREYQQRLLEQNRCVTISSVMITVFIGRYIASELIMIVINSHDTVTLYKFG